MVHEKRFQEVLNIANKDRRECEEYLLSLSIPQLSLFLSTLNTARELRTPGRKVYGIGLFDKKDGIVCSLLEDNHSVIFCPANMVELAEINFSLALFVVKSGYYPWQCTKPYNLSYRYDAEPLYVYAEEHVESQPIINKLLSYRHSRQYEEAPVQYCGLDGGPTTFA